MRRPINQVLIALACTAALVACGGDDASSTGGGGSGRVLPFDAEDRCESDLRAIGCPSGPLAERGTTFAYGDLSFTYRGVRIDESEGPPTRYYAYFDIRSDGAEPLNWGQTLYGTSLTVVGNAVDDAYTLRNCASFPEIPGSSSSENRLPPGATMTMRWCFALGGEVGPDDDPPRFELRGEAMEFARFAIVGQDADRGAAGDVVASIDRLVEANPDWDPSFIRERAVLESGGSGGPGE